MGGSREHMEGAIGAMFTRQADLNRLMILNLMSIQISLMDAIKDPEKIQEIISNLMFNREKFTFGDLIAVINDESFDDVTKEIFRNYFKLMRIPESY